MKSAMIALILSCLASVTAFADNLVLQPDAPTRYTVVKGDTLWGISGRFLKDPWKWPKIWGMNRDEIKNPHWIYPGDVIVLELVNGQPHLSIEHSQNMPTIKLGPEIRASRLDNAGILPIPASVINAFATQPRVIDPATLANAPVIIDYRDGHIAVGAGDDVWAAGHAGNTENWDIVSSPEPIVEPGTKTILGYSVRVLGTGHTALAGDPMKVGIDTSTSEVEIGNRLIPQDNNIRIDYVPHEPDHPVLGRIIDTVDILAEAGNYNTVLLDKGLSDGLDPGTVLAIYQPGQQQDKISIPASRVGVCMVYRVFDKVSYALIMTTNRSVMNGYLVQNP